VGWGGVEWGGCVPGPAQAVGPRLAEVSVRGAWADSSATTNCYWKFGPSRENESRPAEEKGESQEPVLGVDVMGKPLMFARRNRESPN
jgi:hypothetical protein